MLVEMQVIELRELLLIDGITTAGRGIPSDSKFLSSQQLFSILLLLLLRVVEILL